MLNKWFKLLTALNLFPNRLNGKCVFKVEVFVFFFCSYQAGRSHTGFFYLSWFQILIQEPLSELPTLFRNWQFTANPGLLRTFTHYKPVIKLLYMTKELHFELLITGLDERSSFCGNLRNFCRGLKKPTFNQSEISLQRLFKGWRVFFLQLRLLFTHLRRRKTKFWSNQAQSELDFFLFTSLLSILPETVWGFFLISTSSPSVCVFLLFFIPMAVKEEIKDKKITL